MIKELVIASGKGGTGKTSLTASFARLAQSKVITDCDVDAADLHLVLNHRILKEESFSDGKKGYINNKLCSGCGKCKSLCRFDAIEQRDNQFYIEKTFCEGCALCSEFCPEQAIEMVDHESGKYFISETEYGPFVHAKLNIAEGNSGKLVTLIRKKAREIATEKGLQLIITDGSPGIGCPVIASITGATFLLIVTEPTVSGLHDLKRVFNLAQHFRVKCGLCVNKYDINMEKTQEIKNFCEENELHFLGQIPYDKAVTEAQIMGKAVIELKDSQAANAIIELWGKVFKQI